MRPVGSSSFRSRSHSPALFPFPVLRRSGGGEKKEGLVVERRTCVLGSGVAERSRPAEYVIPSGCYFAAVSTDSAYEAP